MISWKFEGTVRLLAEGITKPGAFNKFHRGSAIYFRRTRMRIDRGRNKYAQQR